MDSIDKRIGELANSLYLDLVQLPQWPRIVDFVRAAARATSDEGYVEGCCDALESLGKETA